MVNAPERLIEEWIYDVETNRTGAIVEQSQVTIIWSIAVSIFCVGGMIGAWVTGYVADKVGRKGGLLLNNLVVVIASVLQGIQNIYLSTHSIFSIVINLYFYGDFESIIKLIHSNCFTGCSKSAHSYEMLILGRFFIGLNSGLNAGLAPMYLAEISPVRLRGAVSNSIKPSFIL